MKRRGRPPLSVPPWECHLHLRLRPGEDDDLIAFLRNLPERKRVAAVKGALRSGGMMPVHLHQDVSDDELSTALDNFLK